jgi:hypothetical protein
LKREDHAVSGEISGQRKKMMTWPGRWGPHVSEGERKERYRFGIGEVGHGLHLNRAGKVCPEAFFLFFFFSPFSFSAFLFPL